MASAYAIPSRRLRRAGRVAAVTGLAAAAVMVGEAQTTATQGTVQEVDVEEGLVVVATGRDRWAMMSDRLATMVERGDIVVIRRFPDGRLSVRAIKEATR